MRGGVCRVGEIGGIGEGQMAELDLAAQLEVGRDAWIGGGIVDGRLLDEQLVDAGDGCGAALEEIDHPADGDDRPGHHHHVGVEGDEVADRDAMVDDLVAADQQGDA